MKWKVTWPTLGGSLGIQGGELPFFCHDVTARSLRVPLGEENMKHSTFAYGIKRMSIYVPEERVAMLAKAFEAVLDTPNIADKGVEKGLGVFEIERMNKVKGVEDTIRFYVQAPPEERQRDGMRVRDGVLIGDIVVGSLPILSENGILVRLDIPVEEGVGSIFLDLDMQSGRSKTGVEE